MDLTTFTIDRFWNRVNMSNINDCWNWTSPKDKDGYGLFTSNGERYRAHRFSYLLHNNKTIEEIKGLSVLHKCDNPSCVNPNHLFLGTQTDNMRDMVKKKRHFSFTKPERIARGLKHGAYTKPERTVHKGEENGMAILTWVQVNEIRRKYKNGILRSDLAKEYNMGWQTIDYIVKGKLWKDENYKPA